MKTSGSCIKVSHIQADQYIGPAIECGFQHHFISRIARLWAPQVMQMYRLYIQTQRIKKRICHLQRSAACL